MARKRKMSPSRRATPTHSYYFKLPVDRWAAIQAVAQARGMTVADWLRNAIRTQLYIDAAGPEADTILTLAAQALAPVQAAADQAAAGVEAVAQVLVDLLAQVMALQGVEPGEAETLAADRVAAAWEAVRDRAD